MPALGLGRRPQHLLLGHDPAHESEKLPDHPASWSVCAHWAPLSVEISKQEYWSGFPFPPPGDLPNPGMKPTSPAVAGGFLTTIPPG